MSDVRLRIEGTPEQVEACFWRLDRQFAVIDASRDYPNRGGSQLVRRYVQIRLDPLPGAEGSR